MPKALRLIAFAPAALALMAGAAASAQSREAPEEKPFISASQDNMLDAVTTCEAAKSGAQFDTNKIISDGWRRLRPPGGMPDGQSMFSNRPSGSSITIAPSETGPNAACIIIGWMDDANGVGLATSMIASRLEIVMVPESEQVSKAHRDGWEYTFAMLTRPEVTDQVRMIVVIATEE